MDPERSTWIPTSLIIRYGNWILLPYGALINNRYKKNDASKGLRLAHCTTTYMAYMCITQHPYLIWQGDMVVIQIENDSGKSTLSSNMHLTQIRRMYMLEKAASVKGVWVSAGVTLNASWCFRNIFKIVPESKMTQRRMNNKRPPKDLKDRFICSRPLPAMELCSQMLECIL